MTTWNKKLNCFILFLGVKVDGVLQTKKTEATGGSMCCWQTIWTGIEDVSFQVHHWNSEKLKKTEIFELFFQENAQKDNKTQEILNEVDQWENQHKDKEKEIYTSIKCYTETFL